MLSIAYYLAEFLRKVRAFYFLANCQCAYYLAKCHNRLEMIVVPVTLPRQLSKNCECASTGRRLPITQPRAPLPCLAASPRHRRRRRRAVPD